MSHLYKLVQNNNEEMPKCYQKWYAKPVYTETIGLMDIAELSRLASALAEPTPWRTSTPARTSAAAVCCSSLKSPPTPLPTSA